MSINVTVNGNPLSIKRGKMVLSDLDQIKKNERDRRRRLRLEQVRQQSKEISDRLLERVKNITKQEQKKLECHDIPNSRYLNERIMEIQEKYQEDMADIGLAHLSAMLEPNHNVQEKERNNKLIASKRGKEAAKQLHEEQQKESVQQQHQNRLRQVRELENLRSSMVAKLPHISLGETNITEDEIDEENKQQTFVKKKPRKQCHRKSPGKTIHSHKRGVASDLKIRTPRLKSKLRKLKDNSNKDLATSQEKSVNIAAEEHSTGKTTTTETNTEQVILEIGRSDKNSGKVVSVSTAAPIEVNKTLRYNPQDYIQSTSDSNCSSQSDSSSSLGDDCSCLLTNTIQSKCVRTPKQSIKSVVNDKVQLYDHTTHQSNVYNKPAGVVERIHAWTEPSAMDIARETEKSEAVKSHLTENRKATQKRGKDAVLREKVRRDYQALVQNLNHLTAEERKLKANQNESYPKDVHALQERRKILRDQHKKKLNRALENLLNQEYLEQCPSYPLERQITLTPREQDKDDVNAIWEEHSCFNEHTDSKSVPSRSKENETSREEQILDMLKKVEKQKQLLLKEFGADLPTDIFNATMKPLFEKDKSTQMQSNLYRDTCSQTPLSPEVKVISAPCCSESSQKDKEEAKKSPVKKVEIAVQTLMGAEHDTAQDKSIQVEMVQDIEGDPKIANNKVDITTKHYPLEPKITVITPEADSSLSTSSMVTNMTNDTNKQYSKITHKKQKHKKMTQRKEKQKSSLIGINKTPISTRRLPKTLSRSRFGGLRKSTCTVMNTPNKRIKIYVNKTGFNIEVNPSQTPEVTVDANTQSSQIFSTGVQDQSTTKSYTVQSKSTRIKMRDVSDSSTSFASLPPIKPRNILEALNNNISILEMLDSSANESMKLLRNDISPVSTPETPSPRTMRMPSNKPHFSKFSRMLRYTSTDSQTNDNSILSSTKNDHSTTSDLSGCQQKERLTQQMKKPLEQPVSSQDICSCKNPEYKLMHLKFDHIHNYALKNCPEILQKYEDLQNMRAERIISLTNLIEKVRNEQKGMELSLISAGDETSLMQLPPTKVKKDDLQSVRDLVENIEAIHNQLTKTLIESQNIIKNKTVATQDSNQVQETNVETQTNENLQKVASSYVPETETQRIKVRPKIISDERVNIQLDKYKIQHRPKTLEVPTLDHNVQFTSKLNDEEIIKSLSKEILEQSKGFKSNIASKEYTNLAVDHTLQTDVVDSRNDLPPSAKKSIGTQKHFTKEKKSTDFVPLLADIPKVPRTADNSIFINGRNKPPVSLLSGPYRTEIESSGHELSTIIEFDIPDTINKSQNNIKSSPSTKKVGGTRMAKTTVIVEPSEYVAVSVNTHDQQQSEKSYNPSTLKLSSEVTKFKAIASSRRFETSKIFKSVSPRTEDKEATCTKLQCNSQNEALSLKEHVQPLPCTNINANDDNKNNNDKITSTSSNSFSGLSGISQIASTPSSDILKYASSPEEMEIALKKLGLSWAITTLKKTREASALSSSSNSDDRTPINTGKRISPVKKQFDNNYGLPDFSDVSSISVKEASKSTEHAVLLKGRTSTPLHSKLQNSNSATTSTSSTNVSENLQEPSEVLIIPDIALTSAKSNIKQLENL